LRRLIWGAAAVAALATVLAGTGVSPVFADGITSTPAAVGGFFGQIAGDDQRSVDNATLTALISDGDQLVPVAQTTVQPNSYGSFHFSGLAPDTYYLCVTDDVDGLAGYHPTPACNATPSDPALQPIVVTAGNLTAVEGNGHGFVMLRAWRTATFDITDGLTGAPIVDGVQVTIYPHGSDQAVVGPFDPYSPPAWKLDDGEWDVKVDAPGYPTQWLRQLSYFSGDWVGSPTLAASSPTGFGYLFGNEVEPDPAIYDVALYRDGDFPLSPFYTGYAAQGAQPGQSTPPRVGTPISAEVEPDMTSPGAYVGVPSYRWTIDGSSIPDATLAVYTPAAGDLGHDLGLVITVSADGYATQSQTFDLGIIVQRGQLPAANGAPTITGQALVGSMLTAHEDGWTAPGAALSFTWQIIDPNGTVTTRIGPTLQLTPAMAYGWVGVSATLSAPGFTSMTSGVTGTNVGCPSLAPGRPTISGSVQVGSTLSAKPGVWPAGTSLHYRWFADGNAISGATAATLVLAPAQYGTAIDVEVSGSVGACGGTIVWSSRTQKVASGTWKGHPEIGAVLAGPDRYSTAVAISQDSYPQPGSAKTVVIASGENFPDALSAAPAAVKLGGPLLLTERAALPAVVASELKRLAPQHIVVVGGTGAVSAAVVAQLRTIAPTIRISGSDRYATSLAVAKYAFGSTKVPAVFFATGMSFADALSAGSYGAATGTPVLLVPPTATSLPSQLTSWLKSAHATRLFIAGGTGALSEETQATIERLNYEGAEVFAGSDRYDTNRQINAYASAYLGATSAYLASGQNFPDALAGAAAAGKAGVPLYLVQSGCIPAATLNATGTARIATVKLLGGSAALGSGVRNMSACG